MKGLTAGGVLLTGAGVAAAWWSSRRRQPEEARLVVTVNRPPSEVKADGRLPEPLERVGDSAAFEVRPAPGGRGTEIEARLSETPAQGGALARLAGDDPRQPVRRALREAKSLLETGEVVRADEPSTTRSTPMGTGSVIVSWSVPSSAAAAAGTASRACSPSVTTATPIRVSAR
jgi:hypothetical protein